jgi:hypothetical protein
MLPWRLAIQKEGPATNVSTMSKLRSSAAGVLYTLCAITVIGILIQGLGIAHQQAGLVGILVGLFVLPLLTVATPFYAGFALDNWRILTVDVVWLIVLFGLALFLERKSD